MTYADVEKLLIGWLPNQITPKPTVATKTPATLSGPFVKVNRIGGPASWGVDRATVDVECFASDYGTASLLARQVQSAFEFSLAGVKNGEGWVSLVGTVSGPSWASYDDTTVQRFVATYQVTVHSLT